MVLKEVLGIYTTYEYTRIHSQTRRRSSHPDSRHEEPPWERELAQYRQAGQRIGGTAGRLAYLGVSGMDMMSSPELAPLLVFVAFLGSLCFPLTRHFVFFAGVLIPA